MKKKKMTHLSQMMNQHDYVRGFCIKPVAKSLMQSHLKGAKSNTEMLEGVCACVRVCT